MTAVSAIMAGHKVGCKVEKNVRRHTKVCDTDGASSFDVFDVEQLEFEHRIHIGSTNSTSVTDANEIVLMRSEFSCTQKNKNKKNIIHELS